MNTTVQHWWNDNDGSTKVSGVKSAPVPLQLAHEGFWAQSRLLLRISKNSKEDNGTATYKTSHKLNILHIMPNQTISTRVNYKNLVKQALLTIACRSIWGFQSESYMMTTSAVARLIPRPPALVDNIKINFSLPGALNSLICLCRSS